jgi:hypothetical protein
MGWTHDLFGNTLLINTTTPLSSSSVVLQAPQHRVSTSVQIDHVLRGKRHIAIYFSASVSC